MPDDTFDQIAQRIIRASAEFERIKGALPEGVIVTPELIAAMQERDGLLREHGMVLANAYRREFQRLSTMTDSRPIVAAPRPTPEEETTYVETRFWQPIRSCPRVDRVLRLFRFGSNPIPYVGQYDSTTSRFVGPNGESINSPDYWSRLPRVHPDSPPIPEATNTRRNPPVQTSQQADSPPRGLRQPDSVGSGDELSSRRDGPPAAERTLANDTRVSEWERGVSILGTSSNNQPVGGGNIRQGAAQDVANPGSIRTGTSADPHQDENAFRDWTAANTRIGVPVAPSPPTGRGYWALDNYHRTSERLEAVVPRLSDLPGPQTPANMEARLVYLRRRRELREALVSPDMNEADRVAMRSGLQTLDAQEIHRLISLGVPEEEAARRR